MPARRFLPPGNEAAAEAKVSYEVMDRVRKSPELSLLVVQLHEAGSSWPDVKAAVEAKTKPERDHSRAMFCVSEAQAATIRTAFEQRGELSAVVELRRPFPGGGNIA